MTVVYLDSVFVLNVLMDYVLLLASARLAGIGLRRGRYLAAAVFGGAYATAVFLPGLAFLAQGSVKLAAGILMALIAFGGEEKFLRLVLVLFGISCAMAGGVLVLGMAAGGIPAAAGIFYTDVDLGVLLTAATVAYLVLAVVFRASARNGVQGKLLPVRICVGGRTVELTALWDSGNGLTDPGTGRPVLVVAKSIAHSLVPGFDHLGTATLETMRQERPELRPTLLPYRSVGMEGGLLLSVRSAWTEIGGQRQEGLRIALAPGELGEGYAALWGGEKRGKGERYEHLGKNQAEAGATGIAAAGWHSLHRGQRYLASAAGTGAGGTAAGTSGRGECSAGVDRA